MNTKSEAGFSACAVFLEALDSTAKALRLESAPRTYRVNFTINYRALFPDESRNYRVDVLEASVEQYAVIWVNGDKFEFSAEAMRRAEALQRVWAELSTLLERWHNAATQSHLTFRPLRSELRNTLASLDYAWASFEHKYITELIDIEEKARRLIVQAIDREKSLQVLEVNHSNGEALRQLPIYREEIKKLVACIAHLNSVANFRRKGRDDLSASVLFDAISTLARCDAAEKHGESTAILVAARKLATDVVESFMGIREYLREVEKCLERVDPHLCNNVGLVAKLVDWEESWEVGTRYVQHQKLLNSVCDLVAEIRLAQQIVPALLTMCDECDVELFMVLPRIIWLRYLIKPQALLDLLRSLLPHRFQNSPHREDLVSGDVDLEAFVAKFNHANALVMAGYSASSGASLSPIEAQQASWEIFVKRVINGTDSKEDPFASLNSAYRPHAISAVEDLMLDLEKWSMELQRHCPEDWNQCSAILIQCLGGGNAASRKPSPVFKV